jgi:NAD(P)-dependent dehydrogenase (short-subunit alcohol dehydrogenase family)
LGESRRSREFGSRKKIRKWIEVVSSLEGLGSSTSHHPPPTGARPSFSSKAAPTGMTRSLAREVGECSVCVNAIAPGLVEHEGQTASKELTELQLKEGSIKRLQTPEALIGTLVFLCSSDSDGTRARACCGWLTARTAD